jgi:xanthine dehydrogenase large subunit
MTEFKSRPLDSATTHVSGESEYVDDRSIQSDEVFVEVVYSQKAHAKIIDIDFKQTQKIKGYVAHFTANDLAFNKWGTIFQDQPLLAADQVQFVGEPIALVVADNRWILSELKNSVVVKYKDLPAIMDIDSAIKAKSFIGETRRINKGNFEKAFGESPHKLTGKITIAGQDHFYLESQACVTYPKENYLEVHSSSQHPTEVQHVIAHALGLESKDVVCIVKRMGGAFGGKESQAAPFAAFTAWVAKRLNRPARLVLTKDDDMIMTGKRNPFENKYQVGFDQTGKLLALKVDLFSDGGAYADLSTAIMERAMLHCDNAYFIPNVSIIGTVCKTHHHPHTAFRGFGGPKGVATIENIIEEIAQALGKDALEIRKLNCYKVSKDNQTPYGQIVQNNNLPKLFETLEHSANYWQRRKLITEKNQTDKFYLYGMSMTAVKFGISFTTRFLNQGSALVNIYTDGSIQVSTGATEMGQGVNTRIAQVVADCFGISPSKISVMPTSTEKIPNTSPTAASSGTDINGSAAKIACEKIKFRLSQLAEKVLDIPVEKHARFTAAPGTEAEYQFTDEQSKQFLFKDSKVADPANPNKAIMFEDLIKEAYFSRISLQDVGYFKYPGIHYNKTTGAGEPFYYFTQGTAVSEVQIDRFTGELKILRTDILMDLGNPINKDLDIGQIAGGFIQGMGWVTTEKLYYKNGLLLSHSPSTYKIPNVQDIPRIFNIDLLSNPDNKKNLHGTKAVGEPPLLLSLSVWTAIKDALQTHQGKQVSLKLPATFEEIFNHLNNQ